MKYPRRLCSQDTPYRSSNLRSRLSACSALSPLARTIRTPMLVRLVRLTRCRLFVVLYGRASKGERPILYSLYLRRIAPVKSPRSDCSVNGVAARLTRGEDDRSPPPPLSLVPT